MPIDKMMLDAMLGTFRNMVEECKQKNISGEDFDKMCVYLARMEELGQSTDDLNVFNGQMMQENLYGLFSDHYGRALSAEAQKSQDAAGEGGYDDAYLLKQSVDALKGAIKQLRDSYQNAIELASGKNAQKDHEATMGYLERNLDKSLLDSAGGIKGLEKEMQKSDEETLRKTPKAFDNSVEVEILQNPEPIIKPIQELIDLGEQPGMTLPKFLRLQIETGMDKAMEGSGVTRQAYVGEVEMAEAMMVSPYHIDKEKKKIVVFDELASKAKFNVPIARELQWAIDDVYREFEPKIILWNKITDMWDDLIWDLYHWSLSYCSFAPFIKPWSGAKDPKAATIETQNTRNGIFPEREKLFQKYFGMSFLDLFKHESFKWEVINHHFAYSQVFTEFLIEKIYPQCKALNHLPAEIIEERASFFKRDRNASDTEMNPLLHLRNERFRDYYNCKFGAGRYESKYSVVEKNEEAKAEPWNWESFKYKG